MKYDYQIKKMYKLLSATDIKTICKNRNLPVNQHITADTFKNFVSSNVGIDHAISLLSLEEIAGLLLIKANESLDVSYYAIIYTSEGYGTFTQRYQKTYKAVMQNLVKKGVLLVDDDNYGDSKLERIRFTFPQEFRDRLPAPFLEITEGTYKVTDSDVTLRNKIRKIYKERPANIKTNLYIENNLLKFNDDIFKLNALEKWKKDKLDKYITKEYRDSKGYISQNPFWRKINTTKIMIDAFSRLKANQFVFSAGIDSIFKIIYGTHHGINLENILIRATELGFLSKIILDNKNYYQYRDLEEITIQAEDYLIPEDNRFILNLDKVPYQSLEQLAYLCSFSLDKKKAYITPDFSRLVKIYHNAKDTDLFNYLKNNSPLLNSKINEIEDKHGKVLLHSNLLVAKINNFRLKAIFEKNYTNNNNIIFLPNDYIAFTQDECANIRKLVTKSGLAVKIL